LLKFRDHTDTELVGMIPLDEGSAGSETSNLQHSNKTGIHALGGIRTRNFSKRAVTEMGQNSGIGVC